MNVDHRKDCPHPARACLCRALEAAELMKECPMCSVETTTATQTRDMSVEKRDAWAWGVVLGWDSESMDDGAMRQWGADTQSRLRRLHARWQEIHLASCAAARFHAREDAARHPGDRKGGDE
jgi:hypothetical protein